MKFDIVLLPWQSVHTPDCGCCAPGVAYVRRLRSIQWKVIYLLEGGNMCQAKYKSCSDHAQQPVYHENSVCPHLQDAQKKSGFSNLALNATPDENRFVNVQVTRSAKKNA